MRPCPRPEALARAGIEPITLGPKEGLALINGTQFMSAYAAALVIRTRRLVKHADIIATMSLEAVPGSIRPFNERLHELRPHRGAQLTAQNVCRLMAESEILPSHADCERVQDPLLAALRAAGARCLPRRLGARGPGRRNRD